MTQLRSIFATLARQVDEDRTVRAGMKLTLDPSVEGANTSYRRWIDNTSDLVEVAIASGEIKELRMATVSPGFSAPASPERPTPSQSCEKTWTFQPESTTCSPLT